MEKKILITGCAGFIGMHTAIKFLNEGYVVIGVDNINDYYAVSLKRDRIKNIQNLFGEKVFTFLERDIRDNLLWREEILKSITGVIHLAAQAGVRHSLENPDKYMSNNIAGFQKVLDFVRENSISKFIYASSSSVYGKDSTQPFNEDSLCLNPESYYAATKRINEIMAKSYFHSFNVKSIGLRFFTVYGPWGRPDMAPSLFINELFRGEKLKVFNFGKQKRDFTYVLDIVNGLYSLYQIRAGKDNSEVYNIGSGRPVKLLDFIESLERESGLTADKEFLPAQPGDVDETYADINKLTSAVNFETQVAFEDGIRNFVKWYKKYYKQ